MYCFMVGPNASFCYREIILMSTITLRYKGRGPHLEVELDYLIVAQHLGE
jgi:hypothetical protein